MSEDQKGAIFSPIQSYILILDGSFTAIIAFYSREMYIHLFLH
jgi:hypothetical protein